MKRKLKFEELEPKIEVFVELHTIYIEIENDYNLLENWEILKRIEEGLDKDPQGTEWPESIYDFQLNRF